MKIFQDFFHEARAMANLPRTHLGKISIGGRRVVFAASLIIGAHVLFYFFCTLLKQPFESIWVRLLMIALTAPALFWRKLREFAGSSANLAYQVIIFANLAVFLPWMYFINQTPFWLAIVCCGLVIYFIMSDWRTSLFMALLGLTLSLGLAGFVTGEFTVVTAEIVAIAFALCCGIWVSYVLQSKANDMATNSNIALGLMAHDLRTPIQSIELLAETMLQSDPKDPKDLARRMLMAARSMQNMVDEQVENAGLSPKGWMTEKFSALEAINQVRKDYIANISSSPMEITIEATSDFVVTGSKNQLRRVINNLIKNAHQAILSSKKQGTINIEVRNTGDLGEIYVSDNGPGIEPENIANVFHAFYTSAPGTKRGMGLYHAKHIIEDVMRGKITARSSSAGSTFIVRLPLHSIRDESNQKNDLSFLDSM